MKTKLNHLTKLGTLILGFSLLLISCQHEEPIEDLEQTTTENTTATSGFNVNRIGKPEIEQNPEIASKLAEVVSKNKFNKGTESQGKTLYAPEHGFFIDTDTATFIENEDGSYHSYTFPIYRSTDGEPFENLLLSLQQDGSYKAFIVSYNLTQQEIQALENGLYVNLAAPYATTQIDSGSLPSDVFGKMSDECIKSYHAYWICGNNVVGHNADTPNNICFASSYDYVVELEWGPCPDSSGGGHNGDPGSGNPDSGNGCSNCGGSGDNSGTPNPDITSPTHTNSPEYLRKKNLIRTQLSTEQVIWLLDQPLEVQTAIFGYLENQIAPDSLEALSTTYSQETVDEIVEVIEVLMEIGDNTYSLNDYPGQDEGMPFNWWNNSNYIENNFYLGLDEAQNPGYNELTAQEKILIGLFPAAAIEIRNNVQPAFQKTHQLFPHVDNGGNHYHLNDKADAFRHAFFNATNTRD